VLLKRSKKNITRETRVWKKISWILPVAFCVKFLYAQALVKQSSLATLWFID